MFYYSIYASKGAYESHDQSPVFTSRNSYSREDAVLHAATNAPYPDSWVVLYHDSPGPAVAMFAAIDWQYAL